MKNFYCLTIDPICSLDHAWEKLEEAHVEVAYASEEEGMKQLFIFWDSSLPFPSLKFVKAKEPSVLPLIDWENQWALHAGNFKDGFMHLDLQSYEIANCQILLKPGPGFGDLSHPTTRLVLQLMGKYAHGFPVIDVGCGSGILTLAAVAMQAPQAIGIDIDPEALMHSQMNAELNQFDASCKFYLPQDFQLPHMTSPFVIVMNMISSEQKEAWRALTSLHCVQGYCLTSGIPQEEREVYLQEALERNWHLVEEIEEENWLGFAFEINIFNLSE